MKENCLHVAGFKLLYYDILSLSMYRIATLILNKLFAKYGYPYCHYSALIGRHGTIATLPGGFADDQMPNLSNKYKEENV